MKLSLVERLILSQQCRILEKLYPDETRNYAAYREALENGYVPHYKQMFEQFYDEMDEQECDEIVRILDMFRCLRRGYEAAPDKSGIDADRITFHGFDGNEESKQLLYTRYMIFTLKRYQELNNDGHDEFNSHGPCLEHYRSMLREWEGSKKKYHLSKEDILRITSV